MSHINFGTSHDSGRTSLETQEQGAKSGPKCEASEQERRGREAAKQAGPEGGPGGSQRGEGGARGGGGGPIFRWFCGRADSQTPCQRKDKLKLASLRPFLTFVFLVKGSLRKCPGAQLKSSWPKNPQSLQGGWLKLDSVINTCIMCIYRPQQKLYVFYVFLPDWQNNT